MTADRQAAFVEAVNEDTFKPLQEYLEMPHPTFGGGDFQALAEQARAQAENSEIRFISARLPEGHVPHGCALLHSKRAAGSIY